MSFLRRWRGIPIFAIILLLIAVAVHSHGQPSGQLHENSTEPRVKCENTRFDVCRMITLPDGTTLRYAVIGESSANPDQAILIDSGGPGLAIFGQQWPTFISDNLVEPLRDNPLVVIEEPWVTTTLTVQCRTALTRFFDAAHSSISTERPASHLRHSCKLEQGKWGWTAHKYHAAIIAIEAAENLNFQGFIGVSFGAYRLKYSPQEFQWAVLANPAPYSMSGSHYLTIRQRGATESIMAACQCDATTVTEGISQLADELTVPQGVPGRSVNLTLADVGAAALSIEYLDPESRARAGDIILGRQQAPEILAVLADRTWMRYGSHDISPAYLAYLDEVCRAFPNWTQSSASDPISTTLGTLHSPCDTATPETLPQEPFDSLELCVSHLGDDPVSPPEFAESWSDVADHEVSMPGNAHHNVDGIIRCSTQLDR